MTAKRRVAAIEGSLPPEDIVLLVIAEAHQFAGFEAYARSIVETSVEAAPLTRIGRHAEDAARARMRGKPRQDVDKAVRGAVGDGVFRYIIFLRINMEAHELARNEGMRASALFWWMAATVGSWSKEPSEEDAAAQLAFWHDWRAAVAGLLAMSLIEEDAREELERRYLGGRPALLGDGEKEWGRFVDLVDGLWGIAEAHVEASAEEEQQTEAVGEPLYDQRVAERVTWLADDARVATFERLGENLRAATIMERRLTGADAVR